MTALIIIGSILLVIAGLFALRATVVLEYRDEVIVTIKVLFIKIKVVPRKNKPINIKKYTPKRFRRMLKKKHKKELKKWKKKQTKKQKKAERKEKERFKDATKPQKKRSVIDNIYLIKALLETIPVRFLHHLRIRLTRINVVVASEDAATTAIMYGAASQGVAYIVAFLDHMTRFKYAPDAEVSVYADFLAEKPSADIKIAVSLHVWHLLDLLLHTLYQITNNKK